MEIDTRFASVWNTKHPVPPRIGLRSQPEAPRISTKSIPSILGVATAVLRKQWRSSGITRRATAQPLAKSLDQLTKLSQQGKSAKAADLFMQIFPQLPKDRKKKPMLWNLVLAAFANSGDYEGAVGWFNKTLEAGVPANKKAFGKVMEAAAKAKKPDLAKAWMEKLTQELNVEVDPEVISILIHAYAKDGKVSAANELLEKKISSGDANLIDYNTVADAYAKRGRGRDVTMAPWMSVWRAGGPGVKQTLLKATSPFSKICKPAL